METISLFVKYACFTRGDAHGRDFLGELRREVGAFSGREGDVFAVAFVAYVVAEAEGANVFSRG